MAATEEERELANRGAGGDEDAFEEIVKRYQQMVHAVAWRMTGSASESEDIAQEVFVRAHAQLARFRGEASLGSWIRAITVHLCLNWLKKDRRRRELDAGYADERASVEQDSCPGPQMDHVQRTLLRLPPKQRAALTLTAIEGLNHAEAARELGCSETTVSWRVFIARRRLRQMLAKEGTDCDEQ